MATRKLEQCVKKRERYFQKLQLYFDLIKELPGETNDFVARYSNLKSLYSDFEAFSEQMDNLNLELDDPKDTVDTSSAFKQFDTMYYKCKATYDVIVATKTKTVDVDLSQASLVKPKLPQIDICLVDS
ncbi:hypothetical protein J6590_087267 [Homalodisca vitripennis]|nr:hypothetical protein J6590_087267 [Homalodisca vitripennis]